MVTRWLLRWTLGAASLGDHWAQPRPSWPATRPDWPTAARGSRGVLRTSSGTLICCVSLQDFILVVFSGGSFAPQGTYASVATFSIDSGGCPWLRAGEGQSSPSQQNCPVPRFRTSAFRRCCPKCASWNTCVTNGGICAQTGVGNVGYSLPLRKLYWHTQGSEKSCSEETCFPI